MACSWQLWMFHIQQCKRPEKSLIVSWQYKHFHYIIKPTAVLFIVNSTTHKKTPKSSSTELSYLEFKRKQVLKKMLGKFCCH